MMPRWERKTMVLLSIIKNPLASELSERRGEENHSYVTARREKLSIPLQAEPTS